jgi:DnaJ-class molecular chaperone
MPYLYCMATATTTQEIEMNATTKAVDCMKCMGTGTIQAGYTMSLGTAGLKPTRARTCNDCKGTGSLSFGHPKYEYQVRRWVEIKNR